MDKITKTLVKKQLMMLYSSFFVDRKTGKKRKKAMAILGISAYVLLLVGFLGVMFGNVAYSMCKPLCAVGLDWMYMTLMVLMTMGLGIFGSVFNTYASLYQAKDNDLLLSMPIPVKSILISRLSGVYIMGLMFSAVVMIPGIIVYGIVAHPGVWQIISAVIVFILVTLIVLTLSCILGWVVGKIGNKTKNKSFATVLLSLVFFTAYYAFFMNANKILSKILADSMQIGVKIKRTAYPLYAIGKAGCGDAGMLVLTVFATFELVAVVWILLERTFVGIATAKEKRTEKKYTGNLSKERGVESALFFRELKHFSSSAVYMLNCSLGTIMMLVAAVIAALKGNYILSMLSAAYPNIDGFIAFGACMAVCAAASMNDLTAPSVSLEGKTLWIVRSMPVPTWKLLQAKLKLHLALTVIPAAVLDIVMIILVRPDVWDGILMLIIPAIYVWLTACIGLVTNLKMPKLDWTSETAVVKQSFGVFIAMMTNFLYVIVLIAGFVLLGRMTGLTLYLIISLIVTGALVVLLRFWLKKKGTAILESLR